MNSKSISIQVPHQLTQEEAVRRIQRGITDARGKYAGQVAGIDERWTGNHLDLKLTAIGQTITGRVDVLPSAVNIEVDLPWQLATLAEKIRPQLQREAGKLLENQ